VLVGYPIQDVLTSTDEHWACCQPLMPSCTVFRCLVRTLLLAIMLSHQAGNHVVAQTLNVAAAAKVGPYTDPDNGLPSTE
jgi:hypothetical protein